MACLVTCLGKPGSTYNIVIDGATVFFKGGESRLLDESVGVVLKNILQTSGENLFSIKSDKEPEPEDKPKVYVPKLKEPKKAVKESKRKKPTSGSKQRPLV